MARSAEIHTNICQRVRNVPAEQNSTHPNLPSLHPIRPPNENEPFKTMAVDIVDLITKLPNSKGHDSVLTVTDKGQRRCDLVFPEAKEWVHRELISSLQNVVICFEQRNQDELGSTWKIKVFGKSKTRSDTHAMGPPFFTNLQNQNSSALRRKGWSVRDWARTTQG